MKKDSKKDSAVSPVIGTILLVAITVVLVAIISAVVMGMTGNVGQTYVVGVKVVNNGTSGATFVTFTGGDVDQLSSWQIVSTSDTTGYSNSTAKSIGIPYNTTKRFTGDVTIIGAFSTGNQTIWTGHLN